MAGLGSRFSKAGYKKPKPLISVKGKPIVQYAIESLNLDGHYFFVTRFENEDHESEFDSILKKIGITYTNIPITYLTKGATDSCLIATEKFKNVNDELVITNCDQFTPWNKDKFLSFKDENDLDAIVTTYDHEDIVLNMPSKYSFIKVNKQTNLACEFAEKLAISENALNGIHYWKKSKYFISSGKQLTSKSNKTENFISLTFNNLINNGYKIGFYKMAKNEFYSLGSPEEVENFKKKYLTTLKN